MIKSKHVRYVIALGILAFIPVGTVSAESTTVEHTGTTTVQGSGQTTPAATQPEGPLQRLKRVRQANQQQTQTGTAATTSTTTADTSTGTTTAATTTTAETPWANSTWDTNWGKMTVRSVNGVLSGQYTYNNGRLRECTVNNRGKTLACTWVEGTSTGKALFTLGPDNNSFKGTYTHAGEGRDKGQEWNGVRLR